MMLKRILDSTNKIYILFGLIFLFSCSKDYTKDSVEIDNSLKRLISATSPTGSYDYYKLDSETDFTKLPQDVRNPLSAKKVELGKLLFFDTGLALKARYAEGMGTFSCASCHIPEAGFRPGGPQGIADGGTGFGVNGENRLKNTRYKDNEIDIQSARPLALLNVAYVTNTFWNGQMGSKGVNVGTDNVWQNDPGSARNNLGYEALETQNIEGLIVHRIATDKASFDKFGYTKMFDEVFPDINVDQRYSLLTTSLALSAYIRSITTSQAPFQNWLRGDQDAMTSDEKEGAMLFFGKARCANCHYEKNLGSMEFQALGVKDMYQRPSFNAFKSDKRNLGRGGFTQKEEDMFRFRVPTVYNVSDAPFFFHGASKQTLDEVIDYKIAAISENPNVSNDRLSEKFKALDLSKDERSKLLQFLRRGLRDPNLIRYKPKTVLSGSCFPNNDPQSRIDLGCN